jgi:hypothetical protein
VDSVMSFSFFLTKEMRVDFQGHALSGTLPILSIFLARTGKTISEISLVSLDTDGVLGPRTDGADKTESLAPGACIRFFSPGSRKVQTLYFFSTDISDDGLKKTGFTKFCKSLAPGNSCVKSASYLMHKNYFSGIRGFLLENSTTLVQDDSGIPCSFFDSGEWQMRFFGSYPGPIPLFSNFRQPKLAEYYRTTKPVPLDFGIGYRHHAGESTLMVATRKHVSANNVQSNATPASLPAADPSQAKPPVALPVP